MLRLCTTPASAATGAVRLAADIRQGLGFPYWVIDPVRGYGLQKRWGGCSCEVQLTRELDACALRLLSPVALRMRVAAEFCRIIDLADLLE